MGAVLNGSIEGWVLQPESPEITGEKNNESITLVYRAKWTDIWDNMPDYGAKYISLEYGLTEQFEFLRLVRYQVKPVKGNILAEITLEFRDPSVANRNTGDQAEEWSCKSMELAIPITANKNYKTNWDHALIAKQGVTSTPPSWWSTAKDTQIPADAYTEGDVYKWIGPDDVVPDGWYMIKPQQKRKGTDTFVSHAACEVVHTEIFESEDDADVDTALMDDHRNAPEKTFGRPSDKKYWLQSGTDFDDSGKFFKKVTTFLYSPGVDEDGDGVNEDGVDGDLYDDAT